MKWWAFDGHGGSKFKTLQRGVNYDELTSFGRSFGTVLKVLEFYQIYTIHGIFWLNI